MRENHPSLMSKWYSLAKDIITHRHDKIKNISQKSHLNLIWLSSGVFMISNLKLLKWLLQLFFFTVPLSWANFMPIWKWYGRSNFHFDHPYSEKQCMRYLNSNLFWTMSAMIRGFYCTFICLDCNISHRPISLKIFFFSLNCIKKKQGWKSKTEN